MGNLVSSLPVVNNPLKNGNNQYEEIDENDTCSSSSEVVSPSTPKISVFPGGTGTGGTDDDDEEGRLRALTALIDPRSPTIGVSRTPVEVVAEREKIRQEMFRKLKALEVPGGQQQQQQHLQVQTGGGGVTPESSTGTTGWDPRSPTLEYKRTPLALGDKKANILANNLLVGGPQNKDESMEQSFGESNNDGDDDFSSGKKAQDTEVQQQALGGGGKMCRDLRKRLFVEKLNESLAAADENKEN